MTQKIFNFVLTTVLMTQQFSYAASNSIANDILSPNSTAYDFTFTDDANSSIYLNKTYIEVSQVVKEIEKIANALVPRDINVANCSTTGCPIDAVQCDAVTELPSCPDGSVLNTTRDMCQKDPDVFSCPTGFTYDSDLRQCVKPLDCPSGGTYSIERNRCEFKRIYECPAGYTQDGNVCVAPPTCPSGAIFDTTLLKCTVDATYACADAGWTYDQSTNKCFYAPPTCPSGYTYNTTYDVCLLNYTPTCPSGYTLNSTRNRCEKTPPDCPVGTTYNATTNRCEQGAGSACTLAGGTWNGTDCTVSGSYAATVINTTSSGIGYSSCAASEMYYPDAASYCSNLVEGGYSDWILPAINQTAAKTSDGVPSCNGWTWSYSNVVGFTGFKWGWNGTLQQMRDTAYGIGYVRCVRSGPGGYSCPSGGTLSGTTCNTTSNVAPSCPVGYTHDGSGRCYANPTCPSSGTFDGTNDVCWLSFSKSCTSGTYDVSLDKCTQEATCTKGVLNKTLDRCEQDYIPVCNTGWTFNATTSMCEKNPVCIVGTYSNTYDKCLLSYTPTCASGYTYNSTRTRCEKTPPDCPVGTTYNATTNRCEQGAGSACTISGGTWNGTNCTVNGSYTATNTTPINVFDSTNLIYQRFSKGALDKCAGGGFANTYTETVGQGVVLSSVQTEDLSYCKLKNNNAYPVYVRFIHNIGLYSNNNMGEWATEIQIGAGQETEIYNYILSYLNGSVKYPKVTIGISKNGTEVRGYSAPLYQLINDSRTTFEGMIVQLNWDTDTDGGVFYNYSFGNTNPYQIIPIVSQPQNVYYAGSIPYVSANDTSKFGYNFAIYNYIQSLSPAPSNLYFGYIKAKGTYSCPSGGTLSGTTCNTTSNVAPSCPVGYTHDGSGRCYANPTCPSSGTFDGTNDVCWLSFSKSCTSGTYDTTSNACIIDALCDGGTLNTSLDKCQMARDIVCSIGVKDPVSGKCTFTATCQSGAILDTKGCTQEAIPLTCPSGTDTVLDVCYSNQDACKIDASYPNLATLTYSDALNICIVDENVVCAPSLTWSELYKKCEAVPICYNGMYNPENDFCYISTKECPTNAAYPCTGPIGNQWCSPYSCNPTTKQCGIAECPGGIQPSSTAEMSPSYNANLVYNAADALCINSRCDLANSSRFTYCGLEEACPSGFGVFEQNGQCFVRECPQGSFQENNKCYTLGCPQGTTEQGNGTCLVN